MQDLLDEIAVDVKLGVGHEASIAPAAIEGGTPVYTWRNHPITVRMFTHTAGEVRIQVDDVEDYSATFVNAPASVIVAAIVSALL